MSKVNFSARASSSLFAVPVPLETHKSRKTVVLVLESSPDSKSPSVVSHKCIEDVMSEQIHLDFEEALLSNLVSKGVDPHSLDMIEVSKLGIDHDVDSLANEIISHSDLFFTKPSNAE